MRLHCHHQHAHLAIFSSPDSSTAIRCRDTAQSQLKRIFGGMIFAEALASQETINEAMRVRLLFR